MCQSCPFLHAFCMQEGAWSLYIFFQNHNYQGGTGNFTYKASILAGQQKALLKYDSQIIKPYKCHVPRELPSSQIAIYSAQTTQPFIISNSQLHSQLISQLYCTTRITFLTNSYIFCLNYPAIIFIIAIASQLASYIVPPEFPSLQIAIYFAQTIQPFFSLQLQLVTYLVSQLSILLYKGSTS